VVVECHTLFHLKEISPVGIHYQGRALDRR
jgi:hypothetical protein